MRELAAAQWLAQAETLRASGAASTPPTRSTAGCSSTTPPTRAPRRARSRSKPTGATPASWPPPSSWCTAASYREAQDVLRPVLTENPQQRDARRLQRVIDERWCRR